MNAPQTLYDAALDLAQALLTPRPLQSGPSETAQEIVQDGRMLMASLALHDRAIRVLTTDDIAAMLRLLSAVVSRMDVTPSAAMMASLTALTSATAAALKAGAR